MKKLIVYINIIRFLPHFVLSKLSRNKLLIQSDLDAYKKEYNIMGSNLYVLLHLLFYNRSFRSLFYYRVGTLKYFVQFLAKGMDNLTFCNCRIGKSLLLFHAYGTILNAISIGENCRIVHNVTLGDKDGQKPIIGNNVEILPNAVIVGGITIGNNCVIGPGSVVFKSIPDNCVVVGNPAYILKQDGVIVKRKL